MKNRNSILFTLPLLSLALALLLSGAAFAQTDAPAQNNEEKKGKMVNVRGTLTDEGVECQALRGEDGQLYTLSGGNLEGFETGDRVRVRGRIAEISTCQQGVTIVVEDVKEDKSQD